MCSPRAPVLILTVVATVDDLANIFALIKTVEKLEKAYVCSAIPSQSYENACVELISKYKTLKYTIADIVAMPGMDIHPFCPLNASFDSSFALSRFFLLIASVSSFESVPLRNPLTFLRRDEISD